MIITVDTNVIFSALYSADGASHRIFRSILANEIELALSSPVYFEYFDVLSRPANLSLLDMAWEEIEDILDLLVLLARKHSIYYLMRPNLPDEKDDLFVECAFASNSNFLITSNVRDFNRGELKGFPFEVITPGEFYRRWKAKT